MVAIIYGLRYMPSRRTSWTVKLDVGLAWFAALSTLVLVPTDVATAMQVSLASCVSSFYACLGEFSIFFLTNRTLSIHADDVGPVSAATGDMVAAGLLVWVCSAVHLATFSPGVCRLRTLHSW